MDKPGRKHEDERKRILPLGKLSEGGEQGRCRWNPEPGGAGHILESKPVSGMAIPSQLVKLVWICLSNALGRQIDFSNSTCSLPSIYIFPL